MDWQAFDLGELLRRWAGRAPRAARAPTRQPYHAVTLRAVGGACPAAKALCDRRFLAAEAPRLPLPDCTAQRCTCTFVHHDDRRYHVRRDGESDPSERPSDAAYSRKGNGRRQGDNPAYDTDEYFDLVATGTLRRLTLSPDDPAAGAAESSPDGDD